MSSVFQAADLPYQGGLTSLLVLLADQGNFEEFEASLSTGQLDQIISDLEYRSMYLSFPKFEFESEISLASTLAEMGMPTAFNEGADFSGMTGAKELFISDVFHKAFIRVDEDGTEAAASTAVVMRLTSAPEKPLHLEVNRPFLFLIREHQTGSILFLGRVLEP